MAVVANNLPWDVQMAGDIGQKLGQGISKLTRSKLEQMQTAKGLSSLVTPEQAEAISKLPPQYAQVALQQTLKNAERARNMQMLQQLSGVTDTGATNTGMLGAGLPGAGLPGAGLPGAGTGVTGTGVSDTGVGGLQQLLSGQGVGTQGPQGQGVGTQGPQGQGLGALAAYAMGGDINTALKLQQKQEERQYKLQRELKRENIERKRYKNEKYNKLWDKADPYIEKYSERAKAAKIQNMNLDRMIEDEGGLDGPAFDAFMKNSGLDLAALRSPESQEFETLKLQFMSNMKDYYGGKVSNNEMEKFLELLPDLSQSPEGRKRIIANMKRLNNISIQYNKAIREAIKNNKGAPSRDIRFKVDKIMKSRINNVASQFKKDLKRKVPRLSAMEKVKIGASSVAGSIVGAVPKLVGGTIGLLSRLARGS